MEVIGPLNSVFTAATGIVDEHGGVVVDHVGDALIAAFNAPLPVEDPPMRAVGTARALLSLFAERNFEAIAFARESVSPRDHWPWVPSVAWSGRRARSMATL